MPQEVETRGRRKPSRPADPRSRLTWTHHRHMRTYACPLDPCRSPRQVSRNVGGVWPSSVHCLCTHHGFESRTFRHSWVRSVVAWHACFARRRTGLNSRRIHQPREYGMKGRRRRCPSLPGRMPKRVWRKGHTPTVEGRGDEGSNPSTRTKFLWVWASGWPPALGAGSRNLEVVMAGV